MIHMEHDVYEALNEALDMLRNIDVGKTYAADEWHQKMVKFERALEGETPFPDMLGEGELSEVEALRRYLARAPRR